MRFVSVFLIKECALWVALNPICPIPVNSQNVYGPANEFGGLKGLVGRNVVYNIDGSLNVGPYSFVSRRDYCRVINPKRYKIRGLFLHKPRPSKKIINMARGPIHRPNFNCNCGSLYSRYPSIEIAVHNTNGVDPSKILTSVVIGQHDVSDTVGNVGINGIKQLLRDRSALNHRSYRRGYIELAPVFRTLRKGGTIHQEVFEWEYDVDSTNSLSWMRFGWSRTGNDLPHRLPVI